MCPNPATGTGRRLNKENKVLCNTASGYDKKNTQSSPTTLCQLHLSLDIMAPKRITDKQLVKKHRRKLAKDAGSPLTEVALEATWHLLTKQEKIDEPIRIRRLLAGGTAIGDIPLPGTPATGAPEATGAPAATAGPAAAPAATAVGPTPAAVGATPAAAEQQGDDYDASSGDSDISEDNLETGVVGNAAEISTSRKGYKAKTAREDARKKFGVNDSPAGDDSLTWHYCGEIGSGTFGTAHLWVTTNGADNITARVVIKSTFSCRDPLRERWFGAVH